MKTLHIALCLGILPTVIQALSITSFAAISVALISSNLSPVSCFFSLFRRRGRPEVAPPVLQEKPAGPEGPVEMSQNLGGSQRFNPFNPFGGFGGGGLNPFQRFPYIRNFGGGLFGQNPFLPMMPQIFQQSQFPNQLPQNPQQSLQNSFPNQQQQSMQNSFPNQQQQSMQFQQMQNVDAGNQFQDESSDDVPQSMNYDEAESFFSLLAETDESKCISRLVCEMGANPEGAGEFGQTISEIIGSLTDFPSNSKVSEYNEVLNFGRNRGLSACISRFAICDEESFQMVKTAQAADAAGE